MNEPISRDVSVNLKFTPSLADEPISRDVQRTWNSHEVSRFWLCQWNSQQVNSHQVSQFWLCEVWMNEYHVMSANLDFTPSLPKIYTKSREWLWRAWVFNGARKQCVFWGTLYKHVNKVSTTPVSCHEDCAPQTKRTRNRSADKIWYPLLKELTCVAWIKTL